LRALFLLLLLVNLLFAAWALWVAPPPATAGHAVSPATPADTGTIRLLRELPAQPAMAAAAATVSLEDTDLACVSAGPFLERAAAEQAAAGLSRLGFATRLRTSREEVRVGTWVRLEGLATPEDAANAQTALLAAGLEEAYVLEEVGVGAVVSVGVYADPAKAGEAEAAVRAAGYEPRSAERLREEDVTWLDVDRQANGGLPSNEQLRAPVAGPPAELELRPCPALEAAAPPSPGPPAPAPEDPAGLPPVPGPAASVAPR
jgi:hypothetical protein